MSCRIVKPEPPGAKHPAKYSPPILREMARYVDGARRILDPCAGVGGIVDLLELLTVRRPMPIIDANEIEPAWAVECQRRLMGIGLATCGDARSLAWPLGKSGRACAIAVSITYGNRFADVANWAPGRIHHTYTQSLRDTIGDPQAHLQPGNTGAMHWGDPTYCEAHRAMFREWFRVTRPGGRFVLNFANHVADGIEQCVAEWCVSAALAAGWDLLDWCEVVTKRYRRGANAELRCPELVICFRKPGPDSVPWVWTPPAERRPGHLWDVKPEAVQLQLFAGDRP